MRLRSLLFVPGRGDSYEKYLEALAGWAGAGWAVTALDWRGQGGSSRLLSHPHKGHVWDFAEFDKDRRAEDKPSDHVPIRIELRDEATTP